tara:strand:+ start:142 stop:819 length:678 start_codon:yes stop_codon:yes gene_type:complete
MIRYILLIFNILIFTSFFSILIILVGLFDKTKKQTGYLAHLWAKLILKFSNISYSIKGLDKVLNDKQYVIISNHQSAIDILVTFASIPNPIAFFTKKELFLIPIFGWAMKAAGMISVNRNNKNKSKSSVDEALLKINNTKLSILNYPEGTRTQFDALKEFKKGGFILAIKSNYPILPLTILYKKDMINNEIRLVVDNSIDTLNYKMSDRDILIDKVRSTIQSNLN